MLRFSCQIACFKAGKMLAYPAAAPVSPAISNSAMATSADNIGLQPGLHAGDRQKAGKDDGNDGKIIQIRTFTKHLASFGQVPSSMINSGGLPAGGVKTLPVAHQHTRRERPPLADNPVLYQIQQILRGFGTRPLKRKVSGKISAIRRPVLLGFIGSGRTSANRSDFLLVLG